MSSTLEHFYVFGYGADPLCYNRAELGRAAWKVLHTTFARFPEKPTKDESEALRSYIHLFQRLYPWYELRKNHHGRGHETNR